MPIIKEDESVRVEYEMPEWVKEKMSIKVFLMTFRDNLFHIFDITIDTFADECLYYLEGTSGWYCAFKKACIENDYDDVLKYYDNLEWYDSDIFDGQLVDLLVEKKIVLPSKEELLKDYIYGYDEQEFVQCEFCGKVFKKQQIVPMHWVESEHMVDVCKKCSEEIQEKVEE